MEPVRLVPIGIIHSPFTEPRGTPIQAAGVQRAAAAGPGPAGPGSARAAGTRPAGTAGSARGRIEIYPEFREGLADLEGFSHLILIYYCHRVRGWSARVEPFLDERSHGVFATRAPARPNPSGLSVVRLLGMSEGVLSVEGLDVLDGTPLLDLKPYVPQFDCFEAERIGWLEGRVEAAGRTRDDGRFLDEGGEEQQERARRGSLR